MKKGIIVAVSLLFFLQMLSGLGMVGEHKEHFSIEQANIIKKTDAILDSYRAEEIEDDDFGGEWYDEFGDDDGLEMISGVKVSGGSVVMGDWKYRTLIEISNSDEALADYPVKVLLKKSNFDYDLADEDGDDLRFTTIFGDDLPYWIEEWDNGGDSIVWVNVDEIPNGDSSIFMRYGNEEAQSESNIDNIYLFYDEFNDNSLDLNKWVNRKQGSVSVTESNGYVRIYGNTGNSNMQHIAGKTTFKRGVIMEYRFRQASSRYYSDIAVTSDYSRTYYNSPSDDYVRHHVCGGYTKPSRYVVYVDGANQADSVLSSETANTWYESSIILTENYQALYRSGSKIASSTAKMPDSNYFPIFGIKCPWDRPYYVDLDYVRMRKCTENEPEVTVGDMLPGLMVSKSIDISEGQYLTSLQISKNEPGNSKVELCILDEDDEIIDEYDELRDGSIDISSLIDMGLSSIKLLAGLFPDGGDLPSVDYWGFQWSYDKAWRDSFIGSELLKDFQESGISIREGEAVITTGFQEKELRSKDIEIPQGYRWNEFHFNRDVPSGTVLVISIHDSTTDETLFIDSRSKEEVDMDMANIIPNDHPSIYLKARFEPTSSKSPSLELWGLNWIKIKNPELVKDIGDIKIQEDQSTGSILNFSSYFNDEYDDIGATQYGLVNLGDKNNISLEINVTELKLIDLKENWTGSLSLSIESTNVYGYSIVSNEFKMTVTGVNDPPIWTHDLPDIEMDMNSETISSWSLDEFAFDVEDDPFLFTVVSTTSVGVYVNSNFTLKIVPNLGYYGKENITIRVADIGDQGLSSETIVHINVFYKNQAPTVALLGPLNNSEIPMNQISLYWQAEDPDDDVGNLSFDLYFGPTYPPSLFKSGLKTDNYQIDGLDFNKTYYWSVEVTDGFHTVKPHLGIWSFTITAKNQGIADGKEATLPKTELISPFDGMTFNTTQINLSWKLITQSTQGLSYLIFMGDSPETLTLKKTTDKTKYELEGLEDGKTYYWKAVPMVGALIGGASNGPWKFTVDKSFSPFYDVSISGPEKPLAIVQGNSTTFQVTLINHGNVPVMVNLEKAGLFASITEMESSIFLLQGAIEKVNVTCSNTSSFTPGTYNLTISIKYQGQEKVLNIPVKISKKEGDSIDGDNKNNLETQAAFYDFVCSGLTYIIITVIFLIILLILFLVLRRKKRDGKDAEKEKQEKNDDVEGIEPEITEGLSKNVSSDKLEGNTDAPIDFKSPKEYELKRALDLAAVSGTENTIALPMHASPSTLSADPLAAMSGLDDLLSIMVPPTSPTPPPPVSTPAAPPQDMLSMLMLPETAGQPPGNVGQTPITPDMLENQQIDPLQAILGNMSAAQPQINFGQQSPPLATGIPSIEISVPEPTASPLQPSFFITSGNITCSLCSTPINGGTQALKCGCGKVLHTNCGSLVGSCKVCGANYNTILAQSPSSIDSASISNAQGDPSADLMGALLKKAIAGEISMEDYKLLSTDAKTL